MSISNKSLFISFEGIDGCGKSTQVQLLLDRLKNEKIHSILVREPGGTKISEEIRSILLKTRNEKMAERTEALLMTASRAQLTKSIIIPKLKSGFWVIADRFKDSTLAYQGGGRGINLEYLINLNKFATYNINPDITFFIDVSAKEASKRLKSDKPDRIEGAGLDFQDSVRKQYLKLAKDNKKRIVTLDGCLKPHELHDLIWKIILDKKV